MGVTPNRIEYMVACAGIAACFLMVILLIVVDSVLEGLLQFDFKELREQRKDILVVVSASAVILAVLTQIRKHEHLDLVGIAVSALAGYMAALYSLEPISPFTASIILVLALPIMYIATSQYHWSIRATSSIVILLSLGLSSGLLLYLLGFIIRVLPDVLEAILYVFYVAIIIGWLYIITKANDQG